MMAKPELLVGYGRLSDDLSKVTDFRTVFRQMPKLSTGNHFGGRLVFDGKGYLFIALGEKQSAPDGAGSG
ncbi:aldose sugar dehydrogenase [Escherichia coli]|uniref:Aldose sugar dehydrogenase n=1 Tax=Escherichia coli TaxID=562 RepID=A0A376MVH2_ECOLX|nr:aldose sugar dehydrogenase [Escherichia coli]